MWATGWSFGSLTGVVLEQDIPGAGGGVVVRVRRVHASTAEGLAAREQRRRRRAAATARIRRRAGRKHGHGAGHARALAGPAIAAGSHGAARNAGAGSTAAAAWREGGETPRGRHTSFRDPGLPFLPPFPFFGTSHWKDLSLVFPLSPLGMAPREFFQEYFGFFFISVLGCGDVG